MPRLPAQPPEAKPAATVPDEPQPTAPKPDEAKPESEPEPALPAAQPAPVAPLAKPGGKLPWEAPPRVSEPILRVPQSPREILARYDIGPSQLDGFFNGQPLDPGEEDVLARIMYRFPRFALENIERWRKKDVSWDQLAASASDLRAEFFAVRGRAKLVEKFELLPDLAALFEFGHYYRVTIELDDSPFEALVCTRHIPDAWPISEPFDEPAACDGLFLKLGEAMAVDPQLVFAARRIAWFPDQPNPEQHIGPDQIALAAHGFDVGLLVEVRAGNRKPIGDSDREAFYQLLATLGRIEPAQLRRGEGAALSIATLLERPETLHGQFLPVEGIARRVTKVPVSDADVQKRFGIKHYYEINLSVPVGNTRIVFGKDKTGKDNPVYANHYPVTLNCLRLPAGIVEGGDQNQLVRADAVFFKLWTYRSGYSSQFKQLQLAPLLFAIEPAPVKIEPVSNIVSTVLVCTSFGLALFVIFVLFWWYRRADREHAERQKAFEEASPRGRPDFSGLAVPDNAAGKSTLPPTAVPPSAGA
ncbi:MAG: hypothetical protein SFU86_13035 [Pirellulaceae bacterium]|nr:hypothetical protein [Pirellulaceae bacterium]